MECVFQNKQTKKESTKKRPLMKARRCESDWLRKVKKGVCNSLMQTSLSRAMELLEGKTGVRPSRCWSVWLTRIIEQSQVTLCVSASGHLEETNGVDPPLDLSKGASPERSSNNKIDFYLHFKSCFHQVYTSGKSQPNPVNSRLILFHTIRQWLI